MFPILTLPYVLRRRFYEIQSPASIYYLRQISSQISRESSYLPLTVDKLYINALDSFIHIDENGLLCQKIGFQELLNLPQIYCRCCCCITKEIFIDQLSTQQLSQISKCIYGNYSSLSITGFPYFEDLKNLVTENVRNLTFCGRIIDLPNLKELFGILNGLTNLTLVQYCQATKINAAEEIINNYIMRNKTTLKYFRYTLTICNPDNSFQHLYATFDKNIIKISVFGDNL